MHQPKNGGSDAGAGDRDTPMSTGCLLDVLGDHFRQGLGRRPDRAYRTMGSRAAAINAAYAAGAEPPR